MFHAFVHITAESKQLRLEGEEEGRESPGRMTLKCGHDVVIPHQCTMLLIERGGRLITDASIMTCLQPTSQVKG